MKERTSVAYRININYDLLEYLNPESGSKYSRMAAFRDLLELSIPGDKQPPSSLRALSERETAITVSGLAKRWNWHRATVRKFLSALEHFGTIRCRQHGGRLVLTAVCLVSDGDDKRTSFLTEEEQCLNRWLCGYISMEECVDTVVHFIAGTDELFASDMTVSDALSGVSTGERLHKLIAHLILHRTRLLPSNVKVNEALQRLFIHECGKDLAKFLWRLAFAGLQVIGNRSIHGVASPCQSDGTATGDLELILSHYLSYIGKETLPRANNSLKANATPPGG